MIHKVFHLINFTPSQVSYVIYLASAEDKKLIAILKKELDKKAKRLLHMNIIVKEIIAKNRLTQ